MRMVDQHGNPWGGGVKNEADDHDHNGDDDEEWCNEDEDGTRMEIKRVIMSCMVGRGGDDECEHESEDG